jgi:hypothetical protein
MADPTPEELEELGVTITPNPAPERAPFAQVSRLPDEPKSDVKIKLESGEVFRERLVRVADAAGYNFSISNALLAADGSVAQADDGSLLIVPHEVCHEFRIEGVDMGKMTPEQIEEALQHAREVAAAKARSFFAGMEMGAALFGDRINDPPPSVALP